MSDLEARIENAVSRTLAADGWHVALSVRHRIAQAVMVVINGQDEPDPAAVYGGDLAPPLCCCKRGLMCADCGTGRHRDCPDRDDQDDEYKDGFDDEDGDE
jgi:hypothetical protein